MDIKLNTTANQMRVVKVNGTHLKGKTNKNVLSLHLLSPAMFYLPRNVFGFFPLLKAYTVHGLDASNQYLQSGALARGDFSGGSSLFRIEIKNVVLVELRPYVFEGVKNVTFLSLHNNLIVKVHRDAFQNLTRLKHLELNSNYIKFLDKATFAPLENLKKLSLGGNYLQEIHSSLFANLKALESVTFLYNVVEVIDETIIDALPELMQFGLVKNVCVDEYFVREHNCPVCKELEIQQFKELVRNCTEDNVLKVKVKTLEDKLKNSTELLSLLGLEIRKLEQKITELNWVLKQQEVMDKNATNTITELSKQLTIVITENLRLSAKNEELSSSVDNLYWTAEDLKDQKWSLEREKKKLQKELKKCEEDDDCWFRTFFCW